MPVVYYYNFLIFGMIFRLGKVAAATLVVDIAIQKVGIDAAEIKLIFQVMLYHLSLKNTLNRMLSVKL